MKQRFDQILPAFISPMLAKSGKPFDSEDFLFEIKWDGTRTLAFSERKTLRLVNRRRLDMTDRYPELSFLKDLPGGTILDGEIVVLHEGKSDFGMLQSREQSRSPFKIKLLSRSSPATYMVFDLLYLDHQSLLHQPLYQRRECLKELVNEYGQGRMLLSSSIEGKNGTALFAEACSRGLEGLIAKRANSTYQPGKRSGDWVKIKRAEILDCVIIGFLPSGKDDFRSLILASLSDGKLKCVGKVGTGFDTKLRKKLNRWLRGNLRAKPIIPCKIKGVWVDPGLYCKITCMERTAGGELRAPAFVELIEE
ncbi:MAG: non-homologous end-joining DNA ligase [Planctomycetia bacterium]|nr:non-homologous end-joining DNA ligase [Planctomycetia bacterium]